MEDERSTARHRRRYTLGFAAICLGLLGGTCPDAAARLISRDAVSSESTLDLARVTHVAADSGPYADAFAAVASPGWIRHPGVTADLFERPSATPDMPGTLSAGPAGFNVTAGVEEARSSRYDVTSPAGERVIWARA